MVISRFAIFEPHHRELILFQAYAGLRAEASRTHLSFLWWVLEPILFMGVFYVVFDLLFDRGTEDFVAFLLVGLVIWQWFANSIIHGMRSIQEKGQLMMHVNFPKEICPTIVILMDIVKFSFVFILLIVFLWAYGMPVSSAYLALPLVLIIQFLLLTMFTYLVAALVPFLPDLTFLVDAFLRLAFFLSGVFFAGESIPDEYQKYFYLNPMANLIEAHRDILLFGVWPEWGALLKIGILATAGVLAAQWLLRRLDHIYPRLAEV